MACCSAIGTLLSSRRACISLVRSDSLNDLGSEITDRLDDHKHGVLTYFRVGKAAGGDIARRGWSEHGYHAERIRPMRPHEADGRHQN